MDPVTQTYTSLEINIFGVPDTMPCTNQFVPDIKEIVTILYRTMIVAGHLFKGLPIYYHTLMIIEISYV